MKVNGLVMKREEAGDSGRNKNSRVYPLSTYDFTYNGTKKLKKWKWQLAERASSENGNSN